MSESSVLWVTCHKSGQLACIHSPSLGPVHGYKGLQALVHHSTVSVVSGQILEQKISSVLSKGAIRAVPAAESQLGFYFLYFLVPKKGLGAMQTHNMLSRSICQRDWFTNVDLQDAYFHISILPAHKRFQVRLLGHGLQVSSCPFQTSTSPSDFYQVCGGGINAGEVQGTQIL